ncbi:MAG: thioredoxin-disulfide reductase [Candidatus Latescibacteria bacterium]|nr:thioredoxin-disulfide reductase [Candidatus Latescibacterota bacterium]
MDTIHDIIIIGGGAAGLTAGLYACRANMDTLLVEKLIPGGQAAMTAFVENYPGFTDGVSGYDLMDAMRKQAEKFGLDIKNYDIKHINKHDDIFCIGTSNCEIHARTIIICTGVHPRKLDVPGEDELFGRGISTCATCDGAFYRDMEVAVVGGGDSAIEEGLYLTRFASKVHIIHRRDKFRALASFVEKAREDPKVEFHLDTVVTAVKGENSVEGVSLRNVKTGDESLLPVAGVFLYIGLIPNTTMFRDFLDLDDNGFIRVDDNLQTSAPGVCAAGDVRVTPLRQIITAASDGAVCSYSAGKFLEKIEG